MRVMFANPALVDLDYDAADITPAYLENGGKVGGRQGYLDGPTAGLYGIPFSAQTTLMACRKDLLDKHGIDVPQTYDELVVASRTLKEYEGMLAMLEPLAALEPSHTRRSEEQVAMQQFSTPLPLAYAALQAAAVRLGDVVLEPSAGTGMLAVLAECALGSWAEGALHLNELGTTRAGLLDALFPDRSDAPPRCTGMHTM